LLPIGNIIRVSRSKHKTREQKFSKSIWKMEEEEKKEAEDAEMKEPE
jgi:hypothetical protein